MLSISIPNNVKISWNDTFIKIAGPLGTLIKKKGDLILVLKDNRLYLVNDTENTSFYFTILRSLISGVSKGYRVKLRLVGVGYKATMKENKLILKIGYSHEVIYNIPENIQIICSKAKGTLLLIKGLELYRVKQIAAEIRALHLPDPYKGKGIQYAKETLKLKKGKRESR